LTSRADGGGETELFEFLDSAFGRSFDVDLVEEGFAEVAEWNCRLQDVVDGDQEFMGDGEARLASADECFELVIFGLDVAPFRL
jgi:hypothetical protein